MRPRQRIFAVDYIERAVEDYAAAIDRLGHDHTELIWAHDVLDLYFTAVDCVEPIKSAGERFRLLPKPNCLSDRVGFRMVPSRRSLIQRKVVSFDAFSSLCRARQSTRWFTQKAVPVELIEQAVSVALQAPSACNRQPFLFRYFDSATGAARIASIAMGTAGYAHQIPALLVLLGDWSCFDDERDRHLPYIDGSLAAMQFMLALETLGLASCPINWPDLELLERKMERELQLPAYIRPIMLIAVGYPDPESGVAYSAKKPPDSVLQRGG